MAIPEPRMLPGPPYHLALQTSVTVGEGTAMHSREVAGEAAVAKTVAAQQKRRREYLAAAAAAAAAATGTADADDAQYEVKRARTAAASAAAAADAGADVSLASADLTTVSGQWTPLPGLEQCAQEGLRDWLRLPCPAITPDLSAPPVSRQPDPSGDDEYGRSAPSGLVNPAAMSEEAWVRLHKDVYNKWLKKPMQRRAGQVPPTVESVRAQAQEKWGEWIEQGHAAARESASTQSNANTRGGSN
jgi:hypothetical protein